MAHDALSPPVAYRVLLVENDALLRQSLAAAFREPWVDVVGAVGSAQEATRIATKQPLDVLLTDLELGRGPNGIVLAHALRRRQPDLGVVVLTSYADPRLIGAKRSQLPDGAEYVLKQDVIRRAVSRAALRGAQSGGGDAPVGSPLTDAQIEIMRLVAEGLSNAEIARRRFNTEKSVEVSVSRILRQLGIEPDRSRNARVEITRAYFEMSGADAPDASRAT
jgi:DNA-binding NarL/FixJ family response regulator